MRAPLSARHEHSQIARRSLKYHFRKQQVAERGPCSRRVGTQQYRCNSRKYYSHVRIHNISNYFEETLITGECRVDLLQFRVEVRDDGDGMLPELLESIGTSYGMLL